MEPRTRPLQAPPTTTKAGSRRREVTHAGLTWVDITQPTTAEATHLREQFRLDPLALEDVLSTLQRPKFDLYPRDEYLFLILHVPVLDRDNRIVASEVRIFAGRAFFVTLHDGDLRPLRRIFGAAASDEAARAQIMSRGTGYLLYRIIDAMFKQVFPILYRLDDELGRLDSRIFSPTRRAVARELGDIRREVTALRHIILPNIAIVHTLQSEDISFLQIDSVRYFGDCVDLVDKLADLLEEQRDVVAALSAAHTDLLSERSDLFMRMVLGAVVVALPFIMLAAVASLYAVAPLPEHIIPFVAALLVLFIIIAAALWFGRSRRWL
jgi:magnesium transporter